jgi:hypothetical protein
MPLTQFVVAELAALVVVFPAVAAVCWGVGRIRKRGARRLSAEGPPTLKPWRPDPVQVRRIQRMLDRQATGG